MSQRTIREVLNELKGEKINQIILEYAKNKTVLDYGCGSGHSSTIMAEYAKKVIGVNFNHASINQAKNTYKKPNLIFEYIKPNSYPLKLENETFDFIFLKHLIEHLTNVRAYLLELKRLLNPDGYLIITTPNRKLRLLPFQKPIHEGHVKEYTYKSLKKELESVFKKVEIKGLYGIEEINKLEKNMHKSSKNPFLAYIYNPFLSILSILLPHKIYLFF